MKIFLTVFIIIFSLQSWIKADDIRDFEIEGMSIGDSALEFYDKELIISNTHTQPYKDDEYYTVEFVENKSTVATLKILNPTWLQLRDISNNIVLSKLMDKDEEFSYKLNLGYNITAGNAGNILVLIDGEVKGKIGKYGDILDSFILHKDFTN